MRSDDKPLAEILHKNQEENLSAAKKSLKKHRKAYMHRRIDLGGDVIDIIDDGKIIERHRSSGLGFPFHQETAEDLSPLKKWLCINDSVPDRRNRQGFRKLQPSRFGSVYPGAPIRRYASKECWSIIFL